MTGAATTPNGAQLATWRQREQDSAAVRREQRQARRTRRLETWYRWAQGFVRSGRRFQSTHTTHRDRAQLCDAHGVSNTGRQWRRLRKALAREEVARRAARQDVARGAAREIERWNDQLPVQLPQLSGVSGTGVDPSFDRGGGDEEGD